MPRLVSRGLVQARTVCGDGVERDERPRPITWKLVFLGRQRVVPHVGQIR